MERQKLTANKLAAVQIANLREDALKKLVRDCEPMLREVCLIKGALSLWCQWEEGLISSDETLTKLIIHLDET